MRPTVPVFLSLILLAGLLPAPVEAQGITCLKTGFAEGRYSSPYKVRCIDAEGYVPWNAPVIGADVVVKDDRGRVQDRLILILPDLQGFTLHAIHVGDAFREHLESMGKLPRGHSHEIKDFWLSGSLTMYNDPNRQDPMGTIAEVNRRMAPDRCFYTKEPYALEVRSPDGHRTVICIGSVQCRPRNGGSEYTTDALCLGRDFQGEVGSCPNATSCLAEEESELLSTFKPIPRSSR